MSLMSQGSIRVITQDTSGTQPFSYLSFLFALSWELLFCESRDQTFIVIMMFIPYRANLNLEIKHWSSYLKMVTLDIEINRSRLKIFKQKFNLWGQNFCLLNLGIFIFLSMSQFFSRFYFLLHFFLFCMFSYFFVTPVLFCFYLCLFLSFFFYFTFCLMCAFFVCLINFVLFNLYVWLGYLIKKHTNQFF